MLVNTGAQEGLQPEGSIFPREVIPFAQFSAAPAEQSVAEEVRRLERSRVCLRCAGTSRRAKPVHARQPLFFLEKWPMNALLVYPEFPETFWSFKHALKFLGKRAAQPPLGLMTVAALLPSGWKKRLVDTNVERLRDRDLAWADVVLLSGMHIQSESLLAIVERCRARGLRTVVGGPISSSVPAAELKADHVVIGEAESLIADLARELEAGTARPVYQAAERPEMTGSPLPDLSLIKMKRYSTMTVQYSRGCPFNCEFCDIIEIYGRRPRTKAVAQVLAELDQLRAAGWREAVFIVDDNFIGNKARAKELLSGARRVAHAGCRPDSTSSPKPH